MPLQNRVKPTGEIIVDPSRGSLMGNRGALHNDQQEVVRPFRLKAWITCLLEFKGRKRQLMAPGMYTELFFLDEVTALAAGHRPCAECRRARFNEFKGYWEQLFPSPDGRLKVADIDAVLHCERLGPSGEKPLWRATLSNLPVGTVFVWGDALFVVQRAEGILSWNPRGYSSSQPISQDQEVDVVTPPSLVRLFRAGFVPEFHASARI